MGLLDFLPQLDPEKRYGLLMAAAAAMSTRGSGAQQLGQGLQQGLLGYQTALGAKDRRLEESQQRDMRAMQMEQMRQGLADQQTVRNVYAQNTMPGNLTPNDDEGNPMPPAPQGVNVEGLKTGLMGAGQAGMREYATLQQMLQKQSLVGNVDPDKFTPESLARFAQTHNYSDLVPRSKVELSGGVAYDPYKTQPGSVVIGPQSDVVGDGKGGYQYNPAKINPMEQKRFDQANQHFWATYGKPQLVEGADGKGGSAFQFITPPTGKQGPVVTPTGVGSSKNDPSEAELTAAGYASRMGAAEGILNQVGPAGYPTAKTVAASKVPVKDPATRRMVERQVMTPEQQQYRQAQEDWVRSKLRKESGAVIAEDEMQREIETYFPQLGDSQKTIEQKANARATAINAMALAAGKAQRRVSDPGRKPEDPLGIR